MMFLSRLILNPRSRAVRTDLHDCNQLKRTVMRAFPHVDDAGGGVRELFGVLYRRDAEPRSGLPVVIVQSGVEPDWTRLDARDAHYLIDEPECKDVSALYDRLEEGQEVRFRLRANPTRRVRSARNGEADQLVGKRVELQRPDEQIEWLQRKAVESGFTLTEVRTIPDLSAAPEVYGLPVSSGKHVPDVRATPVQKVTGSNGNGGRLRFGSAVFDGHLRIADLERFRVALEQGIGPAKAYGFGLLSIAPVR